MVRRSTRSSFMGGAHVFPGGGVDAGDGGAVARSAVAWFGADDELAWRAAALREVAEETGLFITDRSFASTTEGEALFGEMVADGVRFAADRLEYLSNWVTPRGSPRRFDTRFFVAEVEDGTEGGADEREVFDPEWITAEVALERAATNQWYIEFPTLRHLELIARFDAPAGMMEYARSLDEVPRIEPRMWMSEGGDWTIVMPGEAGYESLPA